MKKKVQELLKKTRAPTAFTARRFKLLQIYFTYFHSERNHIKVFLYRLSHNYLYTKLFNNLVNYLSWYLM